MQPISRQRLHRNKYLRATSFEGKSDQGDSFRVPIGDRHQQLQPQSRTQIQTQPQPMATVTDGDGPGAAGEISPESSFTTVILHNTVVTTSPQRRGRRGLVVEVDEDYSICSSPPTHPAFYSPFRPVDVAGDSPSGDENVCPSTMAAPFSPTVSPLAMVAARKSPYNSRAGGGAGSVMLDRFIHDGDGGAGRIILGSVDTNVLAALSNEKISGDREVGIETAPSDAANKKNKRKSKKTNDANGADTNGSKDKPTPPTPTSYAEAVKKEDPVVAEKSIAEEATQEHTNDKSQEIAHEGTKDSDNKDVSNPTPAGDLTFAQAAADGPADSNEHARPEEQQPRQIPANEKNPSQSAPDDSQATTTVEYPEIHSDADDEEEEDQRRRDKEKAAVVVGARWAPLGVPVRRRLQTAAVLMHCVGIGLSLSIFFAFCAVPIFWPIIIIYLFSILFANDAMDGKLKKRREWFRRLTLWTYFAEYFPAKLHKTHDLLPTRKYIFGYHPHGIISHGAWAAFATDALGFSEKFPGITNSLLTLESNFRLPLYREYVHSMGLQSVSKESITNVLTRGGPNNEGMGRAVTIVIGGARESLEAQPKTLRLVIKERKGFIKLALQTGADLVPVLAFGENDLYDQLDPHEHPWLHGLQRYFLKAWKFTVPLLHGRGIFNYDVGFMPYRRPLNIVVGKPIPVVQAGNPDNTEINRLHELYVEELQKIWESYKDEFAVHRKEEMQFLE